ncbi:MAG: TlpA disulfide reductase family protein, partial [Capnocytophaga sp.]|nr:TlpA disulfide reductase family protein [Capnocytophaga sp.]
LFAFIPIRFFYFPFVFVLIISALLALFISRREFHPIIRVFSFVMLVGIFGYYLLSQPLIIRGKNFSVDAMGNMHNAKVLWDFTEFSPTKVPEYSFQDVHGKDIQLADFKGKTIYVSFWATWCSPCMAQKPKLEEIKKKFETNPTILFIDISLDKNVNAWKTFLSEHNPAGIQLNSPNEKQVREIFQIAGIPHNIIIHPDGIYKTISRPTQLKDVHYELLTNDKALKDYVSKPVMYFNE